MIPPFFIYKYNPDYGCDRSTPNQKDWEGKWVGVQYMNGGYFAGTVVSLEKIDCGRGDKLRMVIDNGEMLGSIWVEDVPVLLVKKNEKPVSWTERD